MHRNRIIVTMATVSVALVVGLGLSWQSRLAPLKRLTVKHTATPTVFVAGDYAKAFSTNGFVNRFSQTGVMTRAMIINVANDGRLHVQQVAPLRHNPTVQVIFADNHHPRRQARQLAVVMHTLKTRYHVQHFNAVGHSSGGNIIFDYLTTPHHDAQPTIRKFVTLGSTYPEVTDQLTQLPVHLPILNVAGQIWHTKGDGEVPLAGVLAFSQRLKQAGFTPVTRIITGSPLTAEHSMLHINPRVDFLIAKFLFTN